MKALLNSLQERVLVQKNRFLSDHEGGFKEEWQDVGYLWVAREVLYPGRRRVGHITQGHRLGAKYVEEPIYVFLARRDIAIKAGMRLKGGRASYAILEDADAQVNQGWQQFCGVALKEHERGEE